MTNEPRPQQRAPLRPATELPSEAPTVAVPRDEAPLVRRTAQPKGRHIPSFFVLPASGAPEASTAEATGAHRFPSRPTPVLGASLGLLGIESVDAACRPWRRRGAEYRFARVSAEHPSRRDVRALSSARLPKV